LLKSNPSAVDFNGLGGVSGGGGIKYAIDRSIKAPWNDPGGIGPFPRK